MPASVTSLGLAGTPAADMTWLGKGLAALALTAAAAGAGMNFQGGIGSASIATSAAGAGDYAPTGGGGDGAATITFAANATSAGFAGGDGAATITSDASAIGASNAAAAGGATIAFTGTANTTPPITMLGPAAMPIPYFEQSDRTVSGGAWTIPMSAVLLAGPGPISTTWIRDAFATLAAVTARTTPAVGAAALMFNARGQAGAKGSASIDFRALADSGEITFGATIGRAVIAFGGVAVPPAAAAGLAAIAFAARGDAATVDIGQAVGSASITFNGIGGKLAPPVPMLSSVGATEATLTWSAIPFAAYYSVSINGGPIVAVTEPEYHATGLAPGTTYTVAIIAEANGFDDSVPGLAIFTIPSGGIGGAQVNSLDVTLGVNLSAFGKGAPGIGQTGYNLATTFNRVLPSGSGVGQVIKIFDSREANNGPCTVAAGGHDDLDLYGALIDPLGNVLSFASIMAIWIKAADANGGSLVIGNAPTPLGGPFGGPTHTLSLGPKCSLLLEAPDDGWPVVDGVSDLLRIANPTGAPLSYDVLIVGR